MESAANSESQNNGGSFANGNPEQPERPDGKIVNQARDITALAAERFPHQQHSTAWWNRG
jgi:hypothetical protein